ncbi:raffinose/stachyose/melibiose transport system permease protein [Microbacterium sp. cf046]|uniref:carbohydrate ABC transporter permease n=1 Tax=Microbacterium sp. cf046 TaxID=1761803 RepID=UPI0008E9E884|nr:carbohydrate ABC transporter permease [Microbacterium sp. cf046]SFS16896.1 raffinose/stachyose/melibiose transport system permease protein [Microbacterium sp. cf046]
MMRSFSRSIPGHLFAYISALIFIFPVYILINLAIRPTTDLSSALIPTSHPTAANFIEAWERSSLGPAILNSLIVTTVSGFLVVIFATMAAYPLARSTARLSSATFSFFLVGLLLPFQVALIPLYFTMRDLGLLGSIGSLILFYSGLLMPFSIFLIATFLRSLGTEYEEAARIDGCSDFRAFAHIVVPLLRPVLGTLVILNAVTTWNDFLTPLLYLTGSQAATIPVALYQFVGQYTTQWPLVFAGLVISMAPILLLYLVFQRYVIQGFAGGLKG